MPVLKSAACLAMCLLLLLLCACASDGDGDAAPSTLYDRLGGGEAIELVVDDFLERALANEDVNFTRQGTPAQWEATPANLARVKKHLVAFISEVTDGPVKYAGKDMKSAHAGMKITDKEFYTAAAELEASLIKYEVKQVDRAELMQRVAATRSEIVGK
ncbi:MAG: group 1 truncated hemoglobin [Phycisphaeraceae bacterium]